MFYVEEKMEPGPTYVLHVIHNVERNLRFFMSISLQLISRGGFCSLFPCGCCLMVSFRISLLHCCALFTFNLPLGMTARDLLG